MCRFHWLWLQDMMQNDSEKSFEGRVLDRYSEIRQAVTQSLEFLAWRDILPVVEVDDQKLYIRGGDMLKDEDQIIFEWARKHGLLSDELIQKCHGSQGGIK